MQVSMSVAETLGLVAEAQIVAAETGDLRR